MSLLTSRADAIAWARSVVSDKAAVVVDVETTGLGKQDEVIEIAIVAIDGTVLLDSLVLPRGKVSEGAARVNGLSRDAIWQTGAPSWCEIAPAVAAILHGRRALAWNAPFDERMIGQSCLIANCPGPNPVWDCASGRFAALIGKASQPGRAGPYRHWRLVDACDHFGLAPGNHRALGDAEACRCIVQAMAEVWP